MNRDRRKKIKSAISYLSIAESTINNVCEEEQYCIDNIPENFEGSDNYQKMEDAVDYLTEALDKLNDAMSDLRNSLA